MGAAFWVLDTPLSLGHENVDITQFSNEDVLLIQCGSQERQEMLSKCF
jgi:hypothetical protein